MAEKSDKAKKAAATKAHKQLQQRQADMELMESTRGPRGAKAKALEEAVWNTSRATKKRSGSLAGTEEIQQPQPKKKGACEAKSSSKGGSEHASEVKKLATSTKLKGKPTSRRGAPAARIESSASEDEEVPFQKVHSKVAKAKVHQKSASIDESGDSESASGEGDDDDDDGNDGDDATASGVSDDDLLGVDDKTLRRILVAEQPTIIESDSEQGGKVPSPEALFNDDIEVDDTGTQDLVLAATTRSRRSSRSSHYSNPPLTDSDGFYSEHGDHDSGDNDDNQDSVHKHEVTNAKVRKHACEKKKGRRSDAFQAEVPVIDQSSGEKIKTEKTTITTANSEQWPGHAQLVPPPLGKDLRLNDQHVFIQFVVRGAIADVTVQILADHSFPESDQKLKFRRQTLQNAARHRRSEFAPIVDIYERIMEDINFSDALGELVMDRLSSIRNPVKTNAMTAIAAYELGIGEKCADHVTALFDREAFVFPGSWGTHPTTGKVNWICKSKEPFLNPAFIDVLKSSFFHRPTSVGYQILDKCMSSVKGLTEPELPMAMVALGATGVYAALFEWKSGSRISVKFEGNIFGSIYKILLQTLERMKTQKPKAFHAIMSKLYSLVVTSHSTEPEGEGALELMDLDGY